MRKRGQISWVVASIMVLSCAVLTILFLLWPNGIVAQDVPPPPPDTPTHTARPTDTVVPPTDTARPTDTAVPPSPMPTNTNTPVDTARPAITNTPTPTADQPPPAPPTATNTRPPKKTSKRDPNPGCTSLVEGYVGDMAGQRAAGATVIIEGEGWSKRMMTDDSGHYGFGGLCAGTAVLTAVLSDGQTSSPSTASLDGQNSVHVDLGVAAPASNSPTETPAAAQQEPTPEPNMPITGYSGWLLVGGAFMGVLLLLSAGARRVLG